jgi:BirA family biotin operon repressor/biotin-[acetyl-CoA-carboxylase] ligase
VTSAGAPFRSSQLGTPRLHLRRTDSTNERARALALAGAPHGALVTADEQTAGRGRQGRSWAAPAGQALLMSLVLRDPSPLLPLVAAVAVCDAIGGAAGVKWPNDVVAQDDASTEGPPRKLAGILAERRLAEGWAVLGIGVNVAVRVEDLPAPVRAVAGSLGRDPGQVAPMLRAVLDALQERLAEAPARVLAAWGERDVLRGREVTWSGGHGRAEGVDDAGRLVVALANGGRTVLEAGEVHLRESG